MTEKTFDMYGNLINTVEIKNVFETIAVDPKIIEEMNKRLRGE